MKTYFFPAHTIGYEWYFCSVQFALLKCEQEFGNDCNRRLQQGQYGGKNPGAGNWVSNCA
jgi:hypothetical protein